MFAVLKLMFGLFGLLLLELGDRVGAKGLERIALNEWRLDGPQLWVLIDNGEDGLNFNMKLEELIDTNGKRNSNDKQNPQLHSSFLLTGILFSAVTARANKITNRRRDDEITSWRERATVKGLTND